ncbi:MAG: peptidylprolyl isomerase [Sphingobacteriales bacterium]|nr:MAG: peptidylprolyl isomerase [Sphingobacteriales bacterium]
MTTIKNLLLFVCLAACFTACKKNEIEEFDYLAQFKKDTAAINAFVKANNITGGTMHPEYGIYYKIIAPGTGNVSYKGSTQITAEYTGRLLDGTVFDNSNGIPRTFELGKVIAGWYFGIPLIQKGGQLRLIIPSYYAYGNTENPRIPRNSPLDFDITVTDLVP